MCCVVLLETGHYGTNHMKPPQSLSQTARTAAICAHCAFAIQLLVLCSEDLAMTTTVEQDAVSPEGREPTQGQVALKQQVPTRADDTPRCTIAVGIMALQETMRAS